MLSAQLRKLGPWAWACANFTTTWITKMKHVGYRWNLLRRGGPIHVSSEYGRLCKSLLTSDYEQMPKEPSCVTTPGLRCPNRISSFISTCAPVSFVKLSFVPELKLLQQTGMTKKHLLAQPSWSPNLTTSSSPMPPITHAEQAQGPQKDTMENCCGTCLFDFLPNNCFWLKWYFLLKRFRDISRSNDAEFNRRFENKRIWSRIRMHKA